MAEVRALVGKFVQEKCLTGEVLEIRVIEPALTSDRYIRAAIADDEAGLDRRPYCHCRGRYLAIQSKSIRAASCTNSCVVGCIEHDGEIEKARPGRNVSDVGDPQPIRLVHPEVAINQIRRRPTAVPGRRHDELASARPDNIGLRHQPSDAFAPDTNALGGQFGMKTRRAVPREAACGARISASSIASLRARCETSRFAHA